MSIFQKYSLKSLTPLPFVKQPGKVITHLVGDDKQGAVLKACQAVLNHPSADRVHVGQGLIQDDVIGVLRRRVRARQMRLRSPPERFWPPSSSK